jgi:hypothetical protein
MRVIVLDRVVDEAHLRAHAPAPEGGLDLARDAAVAQRRQAGNDAQRHVAGIRRRKVRALLVRHARMLALRPSGILMPSVEFERERLLLRSAHD